MMIHHVCVPTPLSPTPILAALDLSPPLAHL